MSQLQNNQTKNESATPLGPIIPIFGLAIASEQPTLQLCKPKLLPLKTYSFIRMQIQSKNKLNTETTDNSNEHS